MKGIGLLLLVVSGAALGGYAAAGLNRRASALEKVQRLIARIASQLRYTADPVGDLLLTAAGSAELEGLSFLKRAAQLWQDSRDFHAAWRTAIEQTGKDNRLTPSDLDLLLHFGEELGRSDVEGQLAHCRLYEERFAEHWREARQAAETKGRLYLTLGLTGGAALALLLL